MARSKTLLKMTLALVTAAWTAGVWSRSAGESFDPVLTDSAVAASVSSNPEADPLEPALQPLLVPPSKTGPFNPEADLPSPPEARQTKKLPEIQCDGISVCREADTGQPFRVLARAFSSVFQQKRVDYDALAPESLTALKPLYVFSREDIDLNDPAEPRGWYKVGNTEKGPPFGWLLAVDVVEWRQALVVAYTHPGVDEEERQRVLMFEYLDDLRTITESDDREILARAIYTSIDQRKPPAVIVSKEPERFVSINENFYLLPIVDHELTDIDGDEARFLRLAAAVPDARGADTLQDEQYLDSVLEKADLESEAARELNVDIVFVMDMTRSMQPYIDNTRKAIRELAERVVSGNGLEKRVRFGLVGYRDSVDQIPALEFTAKNFTPELLSSKEFIVLVDNEARATRIGSVDYAEEVFAGIDMAVDSRWREDSLRILVLVGDASAHPPRHRQSTTGKDEAVLMQTLADKGLHLIAWHLKDHRMGSDHPIANAQFGTLSRVRGSANSALIRVDIGAEPDYRAFTDAVRGMSATVTALLEKESGPGKQADMSRTEQEARAAAAAVRKAALVEYLGRDTEPPKDILVWSLDRDLTNPTLRSLEVRVLVTKTQLSSLIQALDRVMEAMRKQQDDQIRLFEALQSVASTTMKNPDQISQAGRLAETGLLPRFIEALPYKSEVLSLTNDSYASLTADQRAALEIGLQAKLKQYRDINEQVDGWVKLNEDDPDAYKVYPLHLGYLP